MRHTILIKIVFNFSERGHVIRTQGLDSEVTRKSEASMPNEGFPTPEGALAERRDTSATPQRPQDSAQTVSDSFNDSMYFLHVLSICRLRFEPVFSHGGLKKIQRNDR